jgi:hypothetical protein
MPFTPFHFGPGAAVKAVMPRQFSFGVFCFAQVLIDIEVLVYMARGGERLHGWAHTYLGASVVALLSLLIGWPICQWALRWWSLEPDLPLKEYFNPAPDITLVAAVSGAFIGSFSHVFLDSFMHRDVQPFLPFSEMTQPFGSVAAGSLHLLCFILAAVGAFACARYRRSDL